ncbi:MAG: hypothetical protein K9K63_14830 [Desulfotignum sp.]|jgi:hypothetical protein|nr:hypothetical protein [Desulfotignum sp.]MCF8086780.1 hypothetical protein [Desulfotignum sp.]MCF8138576.1 hypothetical protein [Desulfotignum sp.]
MDIIKTVGSSGQISIGKKFAGQTVMLSELDNGVWLIKLGRFIPDNEKWLHDPDVENTLNKAVDWAEKNPPADTDFHDLENRIK